MDYQMVIDLHSRLSFSEVNILKSTMGQLSKIDYLFWMERLIDNTDNTILKYEAEQLSNKLLRLSEEEFDALRNDIIDNTAFFPPNYKLPVY